MKRVSLILIVIFLLAAAVPASAQSTPQLALVQVQLWPEYDDPSMLVIYTLQMADDQPLPVNLSLRIPAQAGEPLAVAAFESNSLVTRPYEYSVDGEWGIVDFEVDTQVMRVEYYDPTLSQNDDPRDYTYSWPGDFATDDFIISIQTPVGASQMSVNSGMIDFGTPAQQQDGLNYYGASLGILEAGETFDVNISYTKISTSLTVESFNQSVPTTATEPESNFFSNLPAWAWVLLGIGGAFIVVGVIDFIRTSRKQPEKKQYRSRKPRPSGAASSSGKNRFCHNCGQAADSGDQFCRNCGTKLRL